MTTGLTLETLKNLQLNAGCFVAGMDMSTFETSTALAAALVEAMGDPDKWLGATRGGGTFQCTPTMRSIEIDGKRAEYVGSVQNDGWTVKLTTTLLEATPENFKRALISADVTTNGSRTTIQARNSIKTEDYIPHLAWVGDTAQGLIAIELDSALNISGASFTFTDKGEGTLPVEFQAHYATMQNQETAPFRIHVFKAA